MFLVSAPTVSAGLLSSQWFKLKVILHEKLLAEKKEKESKDILRFICYVDARPFKFTACKVLTIDWSLPVAILNICVTYLIVIIQFTHIYQ
ncbi:uncharacterized protein LOC131842372 [Achroia grisella]|uniref:uncharacterized protein LOC131842372 n=1 Tax=Achroia grisella TaxID=688607 RepID=UPI0027D2B52A|nr:uncharacterized protein LOC131842372 [Achroia grisella]